MFKDSHKHINFKPFFGSYFNILQMLVDKAGHYIS